MWIAFFIGLIALALLAANSKAKFIWVVVVLALLMGFRATQPVLYFEQCFDCTAPPRPPG